MNSKNGMVGVIVAFWVQLHTYYRFGADSGHFNQWSTGYGKEFFGRLRNWIYRLGYAMASNQEISELWAPILICLSLKWIILKYGGIRSYRRAIPFFLGLVLGDYLVGSIWSLLSVVLNIDTYQFYP